MTPARPEELTISTSVLPALRAGLSLIVCVAYTAVVLGGAAVLITRRDA